MPFLDNNVAVGLPRDSRFQVGRSNVDNDAPGVVEQGFLLPWPSDTSFGWVYYECTVGVMTDSGIVVHNRLPQVNNTPDTLASCDFEDPDMAKSNGLGVNLSCRDQYTDIVQRMGHARYWFRLWGQALRIGRQVPIPGIKKIGSAVAVPYDRNPQWAFNRVAPGGNYAGVVLWHAAWSLWYTTATPPKGNDIRSIDPAAHVDGGVLSGVGAAASAAAAAALGGIQSPYSQKDDNAVVSAGFVQQVDVRRRL